MYKNNWVTQGNKNIALIAPYKALALNILIVQEGTDGREDRNKSVLG